MCAGRNTLAFYAGPELSVDTSPAQSAAAFFKIASTSIVQAGTAPAQIANASLDEGCWQWHGRPSQPGKVLRTCLKSVDLPLRLRHHPCTTSPPSGFPLRREAFLASRMQTKQLHSTTKMEHNIDGPCTEDKTM